MAKTSKKLSKKVAKLEKKAEQLRKRAEKKGKQLSSQAGKKGKELSAQAGKKGKELSSQAADTFESISHDAKAKLGREPEPKHGKGKLALLLAVLAGVAVVFKRKRDQELDEALWEEPRSV